MTTTFKLQDNTNLESSVAQAYVAGWINGGSSTFQVLQSDGTFGGGTPTSVPFYPVSKIPTVTLDVATNGNDQLLFVVSPDAPTALKVLNSAPEKFTQYPYPVAPGIAAPGPFDIFEFGLNAQDDVSAVSGFGLNLSFSVSGDASQQFGVSSAVTRKEIGTAYTAFVANEAASLSAAKAFAELLYDGALDVAGAPAPPSVDSQFFAISDPNDMLNALTDNYTAATDDPLATYWDSTLTDLFTVGNYLSINLSANPAAPNIYSGYCSGDAGDVVFTFSNGSNEYTFPNPLNSNPLGFAGAQYVFQQAFTVAPAPDEGLLQDNIWQALCRGVALQGYRRRRSPMARAPRRGTIRTTGTSPATSATSTPSSCTIPTQPGTTVAPAAIRRSSLPMRPTASARTRIRMGRTPVRTSRRRAPPWRTARPSRSRSAAGTRPRADVPTRSRHPFHGSATFGQNGVLRLV